MTEIPETVEGEAVEELGVALAVREQHSGLIEGRSPDEIVANAHEIAVALARVVEDRNLFKQIGPKKHVLVEGWTLLGSLLGVVPIVEWTRPIGDGWEARVVAKTMTGVEVGAAEAMCSRKESRWRNADDYAVRSMAQTRAVSKALRHPLGFIMQLAGFEPTPEAEVGNGTTETVSSSSRPRNWRELLEEMNRNIFPHPWAQWWIEAAKRKYEFEIEGDAPFSYVVAMIEQHHGPEEKAAFWQAACKAYESMPRKFPGPDRLEARLVFQEAFGVLCSGPPVSMSPEEAEFNPSYEMYMKGDLRPAAEAAKESAADGDPSGVAADAPDEETGPSDTTPSGESGVPSGVTAGAGLGEEAPAPSSSDSGEEAARATADDEGTSSSRYDPATADFPEGY